jgi:hypothetical protein
MEPVNVDFQYVEQLHDRSKCPGRCNASYQRRPELGMAVRKGFEEDRIGLAGAAAEAGRMRRMSIGLSYYLKDSYNVFGRSATMRERSPMAR